MTKLIATTALALFLGACAHHNHGTATPEAATQEVKADEKGDCCDKKEMDCCKKAKAKGKKCDKC